MEAVFSSGVGLVLTVIIAGLVTYMGVWLFDRSTSDIDEWEALREGNVAVGVVLGAVVLAVTIVLRPAMEAPLVSGDVGELRPLYGLVQNVLGLGIGIILAALAVTLGTWLFTRMTRELDEWAELRDGNVAVALLLSGVILAVAVLTSTAVGRIVMALDELIF